MLSATELYSALSLFCIVLLAVQTILFNILNGRITDVSAGILKVASEVSKVEEKAKDDLERTLIRIEGKIDKDAEKNSKSRHELNDGLNALRLRVEVALAKGLIGQDHRNNP
jgi:hypothetical protein